METIGAAVGGRYRLDRLVGRGGFARVYLATDLRLRRQIAVKILDANLEQQDNGQDFVARFEREAQAVAALDHPNILGVYDSGEADGLVYLVMPFVEGGSLDERLRQGGRLSPQQAIVYLRQAALALDYAHRRGIVHRDVKPQNMLLRADDDRLLLADFGIAKILGGTNTESRTAIMGTLTYMAPEQFQGQVTPAVDLYALGVVLFQLLTGQVPYSGGTEQVMYGHLMAPVPTLAERGIRGLPDAVQAVFNRALAKQPGERYPSGAALLDAIEAALAAPAIGASATARTLVAPPGANQDGATLLVTPQLHDGATRYATGTAPAAPGPYQPTDATTATQYAPPGGYGGDPPPNRPTPAGTTPRPHRRRGLMLGVGALVVAILLLSLGGVAAGTRLLGNRAIATPTPGLSAANTLPVTSTPASAPTPGVAATATPAPIAAVAPTATTAPAPTAPSATATPAPPAVRTLPTLAAGQIYRDPQGRFAFKVPASWSRSQAAGVEVAFQEPTTGSVATSMNVTLEQLASPTISLADYDRSGEASLRQTFADYRSVRSEDVLLGSKLAHERVYTATSGGRLLEFMQVYFIDRGSAYIITGASAIDGFAASAPTLEQIAGTFGLP